MDSPQVEFQLIWHLHFRYKNQNSIHTEVPGFPWLCQLLLVGWTFARQIQFLMALAFRKKVSMSKVQLSICQCVGKKMARLVLRSVGLCVGKNQMCHFVRWLFCPLSAVVFCTVVCSLGLQLMTMRLTEVVGRRPFHFGKPHVRGSWLFFTNQLPILFMSDKRR